MTIEDSLNDAALNAASAAVNEAHFPQSRGGGGLNVLVDDGGDIPRREGVEIELGFDRNADGFAHVKQPQRTQSPQRQVTSWVSGTPP